MKNYIVADEWRIIEDGFNPEYNEISESLCSIGNGHMGQRANFEEGYSGKSLQGSYIGGVYYPDKTKVGWWKNGYPEYFAKVLNSVNWIGLDIWINEEKLDLAKAVKIENFQRELDMMNGILKRSFICTLHNGARIKVMAKRFVSMDQEELGLLTYSIQALNNDVNLKLISYLDADIKNKDSNYDEKFWDEVSQEALHSEMKVVAVTKKTNFTVAAKAHTRLDLDGIIVAEAADMTIKSKYAAQGFHVSLPSGSTCTIEKFVVISSSLNHELSEMDSYNTTLLNKAVFNGMEALEDKHSKKWHQIWTDCDIIIEGDVAAQQGIRFNIFQLYATYTGKDARLNIGPKGFTGEKYGGSTYWDTEAYCLPFYMATTNKEVGRNLLIYRYHQLDKAIENAQKLGFTGGAALYPMVTMNGEECHNEWEITFEEIHRNGAIAYAIYDYEKYTGDAEYCNEYGIRVLIGIARFWAQRVNFSTEKNKYVILGVTGPNEYENNVNNNWYTNYIASWCLRYTADKIESLKNNNATLWNKHKTETSFKEEEAAEWLQIADQMYLPYHETQDIILQQDGYLDKEQILVSNLDAVHRPLNQKWSWDRILRSCFIKQADVLQGLYFFEDDFDMETHTKNYHFYEQRTVHESSLSPCVHSILAAKIGDKEKSYEMYLRTSRLDLDDYNNDTEDGLHITSMAGTWLSVVKGFGGMRVNAGVMCFSPYLPEHFSALEFKVKFRDAILSCRITQTGIKVANESAVTLQIKVYGEHFEVAPQNYIETAYRS